ncbi:WcbI family polysaccharide biosynthesis putative acetyltransferase [Methylobacterium sp. CB376]|uniref:WcbI family polysaccharide biosynthesis putative acetyltransferase n=1 Tax=unclassified Methylobacterium TaxID=2615210 RepID=UPI000152D082|nr:MULTISPECIES: WcbI family polysaccharide biosynthesis putative acetyltransferase [Methylobacterium]WFT83207.1 WcbI family polysaccharide biosynthesis putative acetyltransferase [Methylobacterium nodulans]
MAARIGFLGNCQAQTLDALSRHLGADFEFVEFSPVWLYTEQDEDRVLTQANRCDILFCQRIAEDYGVAFLRTSRLKAVMRERCFSWPNVYFEGYFPTIGYIYTSRGKITGPLSDYHLPIIREGWQNGRPVQAIVADITSPDGPLFAGDPAGASLAELESREEGLDIKMSDFIAERFREQKLFFTPNHPRDEVLFELLRRMMRAAGLNNPSSDRVGTFPYTLDSIQIPVMSGFFQRYGGSIQESDTIRGREISLEPETIGETATPRNYDWQGLIETYFRVYDAYARLGAL